MDLIFPTTNKIFNKIVKNKKIYKGINRRNITMGFEDKERRKKCIMKNKRKGKTFYNLVLKPEEERLLADYLKNDMPINMGLIIQEAHKRGDFEKR